MISFRMNKIFLQSFHDVQIKPIQIFLQGKSFFFQLRAGDTTVKLFWDVYCGHR